MDIQKMKHEVGFWISLIMIASTSGLIGASILYFFQNYYIQSPITLNLRCGVCKYPSPTPIVVTPTITPKAPKKVQITPISAPTERDIIMKQPHGETLWKIYQLETERGKTDFCRIRGDGYGGFGVMSAGKVICYESFEKAVERANYWYEQISTGRTQAQALCKWSGYGETSNCEYVNNFNSL